MAGAERGQECDHPLTKVGRHRVCQTCATVYVAMAPLPTLALLSPRGSVLALLDEWAQSEARARQHAAGPADDGEGDRAPT